jgi:hypothetical protein
MSKRKRRWMDFVHAGLLRLFCAQAMQRMERLRQQVEADGDATAVALRTVSATFDDALVKVRDQVIIII